MNKKLVLIVSGVAVIAMALWATISSSINNNSSLPVPEMNWDHHYTWWAYSDYDLSKLSSLSGDIVLFFHADRCPTCQQAEKNFLASGIPSGLTILKVNYDKESELKKKYTILTQTSFVYIKNDGTLIKRWVGWLTVDDILAKVNDAKWQSWAQQSTRTPSNQIATAYFAGGCFRCMEWPFESLEGVKEVTNGYIWGSMSDAHYDIVSSGKTQHREAVEVKYDPALIHYDELLDTYRRQIDPTDAGGQFADRWSQYHTAIYYSWEVEHQQALSSKKKLEDSHKFSKPIVVEIVPTTPFYPAEVYHQDYYKKNADHYNSYKKWSGREDFIHGNRTWDALAKISSIVPRDKRPPKTAEDLTTEQRHILFEWWTEPAFHNAYRDNHEAGIYVDVIDGTPLFSSLDKFDSGTGRPSFTKPIDELMINDQIDTTAGMIRTEIKSSSSNGHLWHVFDDGPTDKVWSKILY
jgi:peptide methionine sulfoxide reductase msrA/msrB